MPAPPLSLRGRALKYLSQREHSRTELARKLAVHAPDADTLTQLLDELQARDWLSDARYVESVVHRRGAGLGAARVRQELQARGVTDDTMREALATLRTSEAERAQALWQQRFGQPGADAREQARQARFLLARGFSAEVVRRVLRNAKAGPQ
ncbi:MAG: recombination regulator RecX [Burkholderiales bacterium]